MVSAQASCAALNAPATSLLSPLLGTSAQPSRRISCPTYPAPPSYAALSLAPTRTRTSVQPSRRISCPTCRAPAKVADLVYIDARLASPNKVCFGLCVIATPFLCYLVADIVYIDARLASPQKVRNVTACVVALRIAVIRGKPLRA